MFPVSPPANLNVSTSSLTLPATNQNTAGSTTSFTLSGSGLGSGDTVTLTAPTGCEISTSAASGFGNTLILNPDANGNLSTTTVYARISASATADVSGNLTLTDALNSSLNKSIVGQRHREPADANLQSDRSHLGDVYRRNSCSDPMDRRERGGGQHHQPLLRYRRRHRRQRALDRSRSGGRGQWQRQLQLGHHRCGRRHVLYCGGYLWSGGTATFSHLTQSITIQAGRHANFQSDRPDLGHVYRRAKRPDPMDRRQRGRRQHDQPLLRHRHHHWNGNEHWIEVDQVAAANGNGSYSWDTTGVAPGTYYIGGYLWSGGTPTFSHLTQSITIQASAATPTFSSDRPHLRNVYRGTGCSDPVDGRQRGGGQHDQPLLRYRHHHGTATSTGSRSTR